MGTGFYVGETHPEELSEMTEKEIGLRMEDVVCIKKDGAENLTNYPRKIFEIKC